MTTLTAGFFTHPEKGADGFSTITRAADIPGVKALFDEGIPTGSLWYSNHFGIGNP